MESQYMAQLLNPPILDSVHHQGFRPLTSSSGVTGFTAQRYPSDLISLQAVSPLQLLFFAFLLPSLDAKDMRDNVRSACGIYPEKSISCLRKNGQEVRNTSEMVDVLAEAFASICSASNYTEPFLAHKDRTDHIKLRFQTTKYLSYNTDLAIFELHAALSVIKHISPGPDEVTYSMLQHLSEHSLLNILYMFNRIWK
ncbi:hypothetical protein AVEN_73092-1 [Araneus ventricosus]|uniref:Uncharacterized protein n=1 Tax=Araneus ventricosus TaxID=182803 RepID=A0A4Y2IZJ6_ARAVE|nr:hypothetical protein AVEN_73092-1 [Araneus ventricosus]